MNLFKCAFILACIVRAGCTYAVKENDAAKGVVLITCEDEYSIKNKIVDRGLRLEIRELNNGYEAILMKLGFVGTVLKKIPVKKLTSRELQIYEGKNFSFELNGVIGQLTSSLDEPVTVASRAKPTKKLLEKMVCKTNP